METTVTKKKKTGLAVLALGSIVIIASVVVIAKISIINYSQKLLSKAKIETILTNRLRLLETSIALNESEDSLLLAGTTAYDFGDYVLSARYFERVNTPSGKTGFAKALYASGDYGRAKEIASETLSNYPSRSDAINIVIESLLKLGDVNNATRMLSKYSGGFKDGDMVAQYSCALLTNTPNIKCDAFNKDNQSFLAPVASVQHRIAQYNYLNEHGYPQAALGILGLAESEGISLRDIKNELAMGSAATGKLTQAETYLLDSATIDPYYPQTYKQLIDVETKKGDIDLVKKYKTKLQALTLN